MPVARDTSLIFRRQVRQDTRNPVWLAIGLSQPILYLAFFGPMLSRVLRADEGRTGSAWQVYVPGLLVQLALFGAAFVGFTVIADWRTGSMERMRVTPVSRFALLMGRVLHDVAVLLAQSVVLILAAVALGLRVPLAGVALSLLFVALLTCSLSSLSYGLGLVVKRETAFSPMLNIATVLLLLLSGILLPMSLAPSWLNDVSRLTPLRYLVDAIRDAFVGRFATAAVAEGLAVGVGLAALSLAAGTYVFCRENL